MYRGHSNQERFLKNQKIDDQCHVEGLAEESHRILLEYLVA